MTTPPYLSVMSIHVPEDSPYRAIRFRRTISAPLALARDFNLFGLFQSFGSLL
jgi:hypothetical protein